MHEVSHAVKVICSHHPNCILDLFYGRDRDVTLLGVEDAQLQIPEHRADKVWRIHDGKKEGCILLEAITEPDKRDFPGIILKNAAIRVAFGIPVVTLLVYIQRGKYRTFPSSYKEELGSIPNRYSFAAVTLGTRG